MDDFLFVKFVNVFVSVVRSGTLLPEAEIQRHLRDRTRFAISIPHDGPSVTIDLRRYDTLVQLLEHAYPDQLDERVIQHTLADLIRNILTGQEPVITPAALEPAARQLLAEITRDLRNHRALVVVDGLHLNEAVSLPLGACTLRTLDQTHEVPLIQHLEQRREVPDLGSQPVLEVQMFGHTARVVSNARSAAETAIDIFRLFNASWHRDRPPYVPSRRRIGLHLAQVRELEKIYTIDDQLTVAASHWYPQHYDSYSLGRYESERMQRLGLEQVNQLTMVPLERVDDKAQRIRRAIHWFAKGTYANSIADSFLMYSIAAEALVADGRSSQPTNAHRIAGLLSRSNTYLNMVPFSQVVVDDLMRAFQPHRRFAIISVRLQSLFKFRNRVAHGQEMTGEQDVIAELIDMETFTRGAILAFSVSPWNNLAEYADWLHASTQFHPEPE